MGDLSYWDVYFSFGLVVAVVNALLGAKQSLAVFEGHGYHLLVGWLWVASFFVASVFVWPVIIANRVTQWLSKI